MRNEELSNGRFGILAFVAGGGLQVIPGSWGGGVGLSQRHLAEQLVVENGKVFRDFSPAEQAEFVAVAHTFVVENFRSRRRLWEILTSLVRAAGAERAKLDGVSGLCITDDKAYVIRAGEDPEYERLLKALTDLDATTRRAMQELLP